MIGVNIDVTETRLAQQALRFASSEAPEGWWQRQGLKLEMRWELQEQNVLADHDRIVQVLMGLVVMAAGMVIIAAVG